MRLQYETELYHHGVRGQKWGVRRYQNADGSYTAAGRKRYAKQLTRAFNKAARRDTRLTWLAEQNAERVSRGRKIASATNKGIFKPISKLSAAYANRAEKALKKQTQASQQQIQLANAALDAAKKSGFTTQAYSRLTYVGERGGYSVYVKATQAKFTDPTQPKNRAERREEKDMNRVKNAAYDENQAINRMREAQAKAERDVGSRPVKGYRGMREWKDPEHKSVKAATRSVSNWMSAQERFADEYDRYKKRHPNSKQSLREFAKQREKNIYPVKKKYK